MKKLCALILSAIIIFALCIPAFADLGEPYFRSYQAKVINPNGAKNAAYSYNDTEYEPIPYDTVINVTGEYNSENKFYVSTNYEGNYYQILLSDIQKINNGEDTSTAFKLDKPFTVIVLNKDGLPIRKGPADSYDSIGIIPNNSEITIEYGVKSESNLLPWAYLPDYNGISGWVNVYLFDSDSLAVKIDEYSEYSGKLITVDDGVRLLKKPEYIYDDLETESDNSYISDPIPTGIELTFDYYIDNVKSIFAHTEYNGVTGWISADEWFNGINDNQIATGIKNEILCCCPDSFTIYTEPFNSGEATGVAIPSQTELISDMVCRKTISLETGEFIDSDEGLDWEQIAQVNSYRVKYNGIEGWITSDYRNDNSILQKYEEGKCIACEELTVYSEADDNSEIAGTIAPNEEFTCSYSFWNSDCDPSFRYAECGDINGWIGDSSADYAEKGHSSFLLLEDTTAYKFADSGSEAVFTLKAGTEIKQLYSSYKYIEEENTGITRAYVENDGKNGWIICDEGSLPISSNNLYQANTELSAYSTPELTDEPVFSIPKSALVAVKYTYGPYDNQAAYIEFEDNTGWIELTDEKLSYIADITESPEEKNSSEAEEGSSEAPSENSFAKNKAVIITAAAVIAVTALAVIVLVSKKKKSK